jgi:hypothetical protein
MIGSSASPIAPLHFFRLHVDLKEGKQASSKSLLPDTSDLLGEDHFADVGIAWHEMGLSVHLHAYKPFEEALYPKFTQADAIELFFDTRDLKEGGFSNRFCHHFLILPQEVQGVQALELTRFRTEDSHPLCEPEKIAISFRATSKEYFLDLHFPAEILHGYDPHQFDRLGFTYTIHRAGGAPQNFSLSSDYVSIAQNPSLWASCSLKREEK